MEKPDSKCENGVGKFSSKTKEGEIVKTLIDPEKSLVQQLRKTSWAEQSHTRDFL